MGMFSWDCLACGFSLRECRGCSVDNWMDHVVVLTPCGSRVIGYYDGYGQVGDSFNLAEQIGKFGVYHKACWEVAGKPEYTKPSYQSRDQGFCHAMHGQPFPLPTKEWMEMAKTWQVIDRLLSAYGRLRAQLDMRECEKTWGTLTPERQLALCKVFKADKVARKTRNHDRMQAYYNSPNEEELSPKKEEDPEFFTFDDRTFDYGWLNNLVCRALKEYDW